METCAKCNLEVLMSHPLDRCYHYGETVCPYCRRKDTSVVICEPCIDHIESKTNQRTSTEME
jgi:hypothetical protein